MGDFQLERQPQEVRLPGLIHVVPSHDSGLFGHDVDGPLVSQTSGCIPNGRRGQVELRRQLLALKLGAGLEIQGHDAFA